MLVGYKVRYLFYLESISLRTVAGLMAVEAKKSNKYSDSWLKAAGGDK